MPSKDKAVLARNRKTYYTKYPEAKLLDSARRRAQTSNISFSLKREDISIPTHCPVFGFKLEFNTGKQQFNNASIDRIDNDVGYHKDNIVVVSVKANFMKRNGTLQDLKQLYQYYKEIMK